MGSLKKILLCFFVFGIARANAQNDSSLHLDKYKFIAGKFRNFYSDNLGNIFLITTGNSIKKINNKGDSLSVFNDVRRYGDIYLLDVSNPLKIIVYYKDFSTILVFDRFMNIINNIDLRKANIMQARAVAQSYDNNYWVFDELDNRLKKINDEGNVLFETSDFRVLFDESYMPSKIIDADGQVYLYDKNNGWLIFDYYGAFKQKYPFENLNDVQVINKQFVGFAGDTVYKTNPQTFISNTFKLFDSANVLKTEMQNNFVFALKEEGLYIYHTQ